MNHNASPEIPHWSVRQIVLATLLVVAVVIAFWLLFYYRAIVFMLLVAIIIGTALQPLIDWFGRRKLPKAYGLAFTLWNSCFTGKRDCASKRKIARNQRKESFDRSFLAVGNI